MSAPRPVSPSSSASASIPSTRSARCPPRRGERQASWPATSAAVGGRARRQVGQHGQRAAAGAGGAGPLDLHRQRGQGPAAVVALAHQRRQPGHRQPGGREPDPAQRRVQAQPGVVALGRQPERLGAAADVEQAGGPGHLQQRGRGGLVRVDDLGRAAQLPHAEAAGAQLARRIQRVRLQQGLDQPQHGQHLAGPGVVRGAGADVPRVGDRRMQPRRPERGLAADQQPDLAGQLDGVGVDRDQQAVRQQPAHRRLGLVRRHRSGRVPDRAQRRAGRELRQHLALAVAGAADQGAQPDRVGEGLAQQRPRDRLAGVGQAERGQHRGELGAGRDRQQRPVRPAEPAGVHADHLAHGAGHVQAVVVAPDQGQPAQPVDGGPDRRRGHVREELPDRAVRPGGAGQQRGRVPDGAVARGRRLGRQQHRVQHLQGPGVQVLQRPQHREPDAGPVGERAEVAGGRDREVGAGAEQVGEHPVRLPAQPVGEAACPALGHPDQSSRGRAVRPPGREAVVRSPGWP